jgi:hypothetical protein
MGGAPGQASAAARALEAVVRSAAVTPRADAESRQALAALIARSQAAVGGAAWRTLVADRGLSPALPAGPGEGERLVASADTVAAWRALASGSPGSYNASGAEGH